MYYLTNYQPLQSSSWCPCLVKSTVNVCQAILKQISNDVPCVAVKRNNVNKPNSDAQSSALALAQRLSSSPSVDENCQLDDSSSLPDCRFTARSARGMAALRTALCSASQQATCLLITRRASSWMLPALKAGPNWTATNWTEVSSSLVLPAHFHFEGILTFEEWQSPTFVSIVKGQ